MYSWVQLLLVGTGGCKCALQSFHTSKVVVQTLLYYVCIKVGAVDGLVE